MIQNTPRVHAARSLAVAFYRLLDAIVIGVAYVWVAGQQPTAVTSSNGTFATAVAILSFAVLSEFAGLYRDWRGASLGGELACALMTWGLTLPCILFLSAVCLPPPAITPQLLLQWGLVASALIPMTRAITRFVQRSLCAHGINRRGCAIVGVTDVGLQLARSFHATPELGLEVLGFYDDRPEARTTTLPEELGSRLGNLDELVQKTRDGEVQTIYITLPMRAENRIREVLERLADSTATVYFVPDVFVFELLHARWSNIQGLPVVSIFENPFYGVDGLVKRSVDIVVGALLLGLLALPMTCIALLVKLTSPGPVFFRQRRYGMDGREILVWKFRSMRVCDNGPVVVQATRNDARLTPIGGFLRKSSLDELPQLFNVIAGQMSLVGPRPHASAHNELYRTQIQGYMLRHKVRPGITGLAQVNGWRGETDTLEKMEKRIECDHQYIREWTLWLDLKILLRTFFVVFSRKNAY